MSDKTSLGDRMKKNYESRTKYKLIRRMPTIIRLDGKSFSTYTKGLDKPFDSGLIEDMLKTTKFLCENIMGVKCGYTQSDEISLLLTDYDKLETQAWFDGSIQKITSIAASLATAKFNQLRLSRSCHDGWGETQFPCLSQSEIDKTILAYFDARVFQIPEKEEVVNYFLWRQRDAEKNSISMLSQSLYSTKELFKKNSSDMQEMCFQKGINWNNLDFFKKRGNFVIKTRYINDKREIIGDDENIKLGDIWYQPDEESFHYPSSKGRLLEWGILSGVFVDTDGNPIDGEDWVEIPIEKIRNVWEAITTPMFGKEREVILNLLK